MKKYIASILCCCALLFAGCGGRYQVRQLKLVKRSKAHFVQTKAGVETRIRMLSKHDVSKIFSGQSLPKKSSIIAYAVTIQNTTDKPVFLSAQNIKLDLLSDKQLYALLARGYVSGVLGHIAGGTVAAIACVPLAWGALILAVYASSTAVFFLSVGLLAGAVIAIPVGLLSGAGRAGHIAEFNAALDIDLRNKILTDLTIAPCSQETRLFFAREGKQSFVLGLQDSGMNQIVFDVHLKNAKQPQE